MILYVGPDCAAGKHDACVGLSWDLAADATVDCPCTCHEAVAR